jgi:hypothetical protein
LKYYRMLLTNTHSTGTLVRLKGDSLQRVELSQLPFRPLIPTKRFEISWKGLILSVL